jgi:hypothetical protein
VPSQETRASLDCEVSEIVFAHLGEEFGTNIDLLHGVRFGQVFSDINIRRVG